MGNLSQYEKRQLTLRAGRDRQILKNPLNWFSLVGLFRLEEGDNLLGGKGRIHIDAFPEGLYACFHLCGHEVRFSAEPDSHVKLNGGHYSNRVLRLDVDRNPDLIEIGALAMRLIQRGPNIYLRVWDRESPVFKQFDGLKYFPVDEVYRVRAKFIPFDPPRLAEIQDVLGIKHEASFPGTAYFSLHGIECSLLAEENGEDLLFSFTDATREDVSYPGGRYLECKKPKSQNLALDFNLARNWPCAYTDFATCPLPPAENRLPLRVEAGEKRYHA